MGYNVFISHNNADKKTAREIGLYLISEDINVWFDEWKISYGESIPNKVNVGLEACTHFLLIWSEQAAKAPWVEHELNSILHKKLSDKNNNIIIIPILLDDTPLPAIVASLLWIKYSDGNENDRYNIIKAVTGETPSRNFIKAIVKKYNEVIYGDEDGSVFPEKACPRCGDLDMKYQMCTDYKRDETYYIVNCKRCNWGDWTQ